MKVLKLNQKKRNGKKLCNQDNIFERTGKRVVKMEKNKVKVGREQKEGGQQIKEVRDDEDKREVFMMTKMSKKDIVIKMEDTAEGRKRMIDHLIFKSIYV